MKHLNLFLIVFAFSLNTQAIVGDLLSVDHIPPQICLFAPVEPASYTKNQTRYLCSGIIVGKKHLLTAGHCAFSHYTKAAIQCRGEQKTLSFYRSKIQFPDPNQIINPSLMVGPHEPIYRDLALIEIEEEFQTTPLKAISHQSKNQIQSSLDKGLCTYVGVGYSSAGTLGVAHTALAPKQGNYNPLSSSALEIPGKPYVQGHDSGGGYLCPDENGNNVLVGILVANKGKGSVIATFLNDENNQWLKNAMTHPLEAENNSSLTFDIDSTESEVTKLEVCESYTEDTPGQKLFKSALEHLSHFDVVRHSLNKLKTKGLSYCATGIPLERDIYKNYRYLSQIEVRDSSNKLKYIIPTLYLSPSVQADHNTGKKPWTAFSNVDMTPNFKKLTDSFISATEIENYDLKKPANLLKVAQQQSWWNADTATSFQLTPVYSKGGEEFYIGGWMKNETPSATLFAQYYSTNIVLFKYSKLTKKLELSAVNSAFDPILTPADILLTEAAAVEPESQEDKVNYFIELGELSAAE